MVVTGGIGVRAKANRACEGRAPPPVVCGAQSAGEAVGDRRELMRVDRSVGGESAGRIVIDGPRHI